ncbi:MAG: bifunctional acetate--CoA ligase family protein/GNAT family N-acetyltransferase [Thermogemmatispora sp.]|uniref:bifunctional acetate--CoA ligase family protein/GNAT family N-acetyltransferase n=1 Tax=Thermogemmatispora sp. TaxID=1968838 RepID=UPI0019D95D5A|nr:bifunctional acetate--CoA ligase family protein/GNAT family N-acetyltransferase [Thermogemmatispora sp.]MBE3567343.1 bifunctional acetate--CoA ligase family protein/GNAT family N-acetyltransferase [Thermogemmatispora sp.]
MPQPQPAPGGSAAQKGQPTTLFDLPFSHPLRVFFAPRSIAVVGATERSGSVGRAVLTNLTTAPFGGSIFPVNLHRSSVLGRRAYPRVTDLPEPVELAVIATPAETVPSVIADCVAAGVEGAIILSAGFRERGPAGQALERQVLEEARRGGLRLLGPNCLGLMNPRIGLNATFASGMALPGQIAFLSQSGALCSAILDWSLQEHIGFSAFVSVGSMLDLGWGELLDYLGDDPHTGCILLYLETVGDARAFLSAARAVARRKPVILLKGGQTPEAIQAAISHTGALAVSQEIFEAACSRCGLLQVESIDELFAMAEVLARQPRPQGPHFTIVTNAGGAGVLAADALAKAGGALTPLSSETRAALDALLPPYWSRQNPVDILGDADPERYAQAIAILSREPASNGLLVILTPQAMSDPTRTAERVVEAVAGSKRPVLASWMGGSSVAVGHEILTRAGIPTFASPDTAARAFCAMWRASKHLQSLYETPSVVDDPEESASRRAQVAGWLTAARQAGHTLLSEPEAKAVLQAYGMPTVETRVALSEDEAVQQAEQLGYPVVLKLLSPTITHKSRIGGVRLALRTAEEVRQAYRAIAEAAERQAGAGQMQGVTVQPMITLEGYELIVGSFCDPQFGPVLLFGSGGRLVEVQRDTALALPPLTTTLARRLLERTRIFAALQQGAAGLPAVDLAALERLLVRFSLLVVEQPLIRECDINPVLAAGGYLLALDARIVLHSPDVPETALPRPAIRPYPSHYIGSWQLPDGTPVTIRPIRPEDEPLMVRFHERLSERSVYLRWLHVLGLSQRIAHERLVDRCFIDYDRELALVAVSREEVSGTGTETLLGIGRLIKLPGGEEAEFALLIADQVQGQGLGTELLRRLMEIARQEGLQRLQGRMLPENQAMLRICRALGFQLTYHPEEQLMQATLLLREGSELVKGHP